jgi:hypothetical protein
MNKKNVQWSFPAVCRMATPVVLADKPDFYHQCKGIPFRRPLQSLMLLSGLFFHGQVRGWHHGYCLTCLLYVL